MQMEQAHPDMTSCITIWFPKNSYTKRPLNFFLAFCGVIYRNFIHIQVYIAVSSLKLLFIDFVKNRCISPLRVSGRDFV